MTAMTTTRPKFLEQGLLREKQSVSNAEMTRRNSYATYCLYFVFMYAPGATRTRKRCTGCPGHSDTPPATSRALQAQTPINTGATGATNPHSRSPPTPRNVEPIEEDFDETGEQPKLRLLRAVAEHAVCQRPCKDGEYIVCGDSGRVLLILRRLRRL